MHMELQTKRNNNMSSSIPKLKFGIPLDHD